MAKKEKYLNNANFKERREEYHQKFFSSPYQGDESG